MIGPLPTPVPQLDGSPQAKVNCGPASTASALSHASSNAIIPTPSEVRARGQMGTGPTDFADQKAAVDAYATDFVAHHLSEPQLIRLGYVSFAEFMPYLIRVRLDNLVAINYRPVTLQPQFAGDKNYVGNHFITALRIYEALPDGRYHRLRPREVSRVLAWLEPAAGQAVPQYLRDPNRFWTVVIDPIADGRRPKIPRAPQLWPLSLVLQAGDAFYDPGVPDNRLAVAVIPRAT
jgi:hypothetical protein